MSLGELIFPRACAGCGAPGEVLCEHCREHLRHPPYLVARPRLLGAPVYALGSYSDIRRRIIIGMKERVCAALSMGQSTADQSELNAQDRWANLQGRVRVHAPIARAPALLADDVVTTGATLAASIAALQAAGVEVCGALVFADA